MPRPTCHIFSLHHEAIPLSVLLEQALLHLNHFTCKWYFLACSLCIDVPVCMSGVCSAFLTGWFLWGDATKMDKKGDEYICREQCFVSRRRFSVAWRSEQWRVL